MSFTSPEAKHATYFVKCVLFNVVSIDLMKNVSGTKMIFCDNCEKKRETKGTVSWGVYQKRICYTPRTAESLLCTTVLFLVYKALSLVWKQVFNLMGWDEHFLIPDVRCCTGYWITDVMYCRAAPNSIVIVLSDLEYAIQYIAIL